MKIYLVGGGELDTVMRIFLAGINPYIENKAFMKTFLAGSEQRANRMLQIARDCYNGANVLQSFFYVNEVTEKFVLPESADFMLDSGAFTFMSKTSRVPDWEEYTERFADWVISHNITKFFEMDIDALVGYDYVLKLRDKLEKRVGRQCIPVWHLSRGYYEFIKICESHPYVAIGGIVTREIPPEKYCLFPKLISEAHKRGTKIHGLGFTRLTQLHKYHFDSVDSTAWVAGCKYGQIYQFTGEKLIKEKVPAGYRLRDSNTVAVHNFNEWKKYCEWAETHL